MQGHKRPYQQVRLGQMLSFLNDKYAYIKRRRAMISDARFPLARRNAAFDKRFLLRDLLAAAARACCRVSQAACARLRGDWG